MPKLVTETNTKINIYLTFNLGQKIFSELKNWRILRK